MSYMKYQMNKKVVRGPYFSFGSYTPGFGGVRVDPLFLVFFFVLFVFLTSSWVLCT